MFLRVSMPTVCAAASLLGCTDAAGPTAPRTLAGTYVADSIHCQTSFDTGSEITPLGAALTLILRADSSIAGRLAIPASFMPDGLPAVDDSLYGVWAVTDEGFRVYGPWSSLLTALDFDVAGDTARAHIIVKGFPLDPFGYRLRLLRQP